MTKNARRLAKKLDGKIVERLPDVGGGAFGAMKMAKLLQERLQPGQGERATRGPAKTIALRSAEVSLIIEALETIALERRRGKKWVKNPAWKLLDILDAAKSTGAIVTFTLSREIKK